MRAHHNYKGHEFEIKIEQDTDQPSPWKNEEGHGPVSDWRRGKKRPGEVVLSVNRGSYRFYDMQEAVKIAKRDGWGFSQKGHDYGRTDYTGMTEFAFELWYAGLSKGQRAHIAARQDFERMKAWCDDQWTYVGVVVEHQGSGMERSCWGIESDCREFINEIADQLMDEILSELKCKEMAA